MVLLIDVSTSTDFEPEKGFECKPEESKQLFFAVKGPLAGSGLFMDVDKKTSRRVAAASGGAVEEVEKEIDFTEVPEPSNWVEADPGFEELF